MHILFWILTGVAAYLLGSIPFGLLIAKSRGVDIRAVGSKNIGATNVFRCVGKGPGIAAFALDAGKGFVAAFFLPRLVALALGVDVSTFNPQPSALFAGACAVVGHNWTCFAGFKGGKGVATSLGLLLGIVPFGALVALGVWVVVVLISHYVSLASMVAAAALGVSVWFLYPQTVWLPAVVTLLALLVIAKHHANIHRLLNGTENRFSFGSANKANKCEKGSANDANGRE